MEEAREVWGLFFYGKGKIKWNKKGSWCAASSGRELSVFSFFFDKN